MKLSIQFLQNGLPRESYTLGVFGWTTCPVPCDVTLVAMPHPAHQGWEDRRKGQSSAGF